MRRRQPSRRIPVTGGLMQYVPCPRCGDPVAGKLEGELTCVHCKEEFQFAKSQVRTCVVMFNSNTQRWKVG